MDKQFWLNRWEKKEIAFHQAEVEPALIAWASKIKPARILVPLCGKSLDLAWLKDHGFDVVGVEFSAAACEEFFAEHQIQYKKETRGELTFYSAKGVQLINGDFFKTTREMLGEFGALYDRAALIALPEEMRAKYAAHILALLKDSIQPGFEFLEIILERTPDDKEGPPHSVTVKEVERLYGHVFSISQISKEPTEAKGPEGSVKHETVLSLKPKN